ncbi:MAG: hypothetical protein U9N07_02745 [Euryarchaeota archaeon]|nr:hypothetical protein [Euryarchaeota archaeon]
MQYIKLHERTEEMTCMRPINLHGISESPRLASANYVVRDADIENVDRLKRMQETTVLENGGISDPGCGRGSAAGAGGARWADSDGWTRGRFTSTFCTGGCHCI